ETDLEVIAQCADGTEVLPAVDDKRPDVALLDVDMPGPDGLSVAEMLAEKHPQVRVIIVTTYGRPGWVKRAMDSGVDGFMVKDAPVEHLAEGIRRVMAGLRVIDPELVVESTMHGETPLTARETEVLRAAADGASVGRSPRRSSSPRARSATDCQRRSGRRTPATAPMPPASPARTAGCSSPGLPFQDEDFSAWPHDSFGPERRIEPSKIRVANSSASSVVSMRTASETSGSHHSIVPRKTRI